MIDLITPERPYSVKVRGLASGRVGKPLERSLLSAYGSDLLDPIYEPPRINTRLSKAAKGLLGLRRSLGQAWPRRLTDLSLDGARNYIRDETHLLVPHNHAQMLRASLVPIFPDVFRITPSTSRLGINSKAQLIAFINRQVDRIGSIGVNSSDLQVLAEAAATHLPPEQLRRRRRQLRRITALRKRRLKLGG